jgi:hypothetical protein
MASCVSLSAQPADAPGLSWTGALKPALLAGLGAGFGAAAAFGILDVRAKSSWIGFSLGIAWVLLWRRFVDPLIERRLEGGVSSHASSPAKRYLRRWLIDIVVAVLVALLILAAEIIAETFVAFVHKQITEEKTVLFLYTLVGPAATILAITFVWFIDPGRSRSRTALFGAIVGAAVSGLIVAPIGLYSLLHDETSFTAFMRTTLSITVYWGLAGFFGGAAIKARNGLHPFIALSLSLLGLTVVWTLVFVVMVPVVFGVHVPFDDALKTILLNFLRVFGWLGGLLICPATASMLTVVMGVPTAAPESQAERRTTSRIAAPPGHSPASNAGRDGARPINSPTTACRNSGN